jgi:uncharacterized protein YyaL (SSP411 family)
VSPARLDAPTPLRMTAVPLLAARDAARRAVVGRDPGPVSRAARVDAAVDWLCRTHDVTGRRGSSKGYSLLHGWLPAYPETTGYVIGTLLEHGERTGREDLLVRAREMARWEAEVQETDGGIMEGAVGASPRRSIVFNTGMVLHGWMDLLERGEEEWAVPAARAVGFLVDHLADDGTWRPEVEYQGLPHTYNSRVAWAMLRWARHQDDDRCREAAHRQLQWVLDRQHANGWFEACIFKLGTNPSTHAIAYTLRGLLESSAIDGEPAYLDAALRTSEVLIRKLETLGGLPANYDEDWAPTATHWCLTGTAQIGGVLLRLFELTGDARLLNAGLKAVDQAASKQERAPWPDVHGALAGSFPLWGRYAPLQYPNWAAKFLADALALARACEPGPA